VRTHSTQPSNLEHLGGLLSRRRKHLMSTVNGCPVIEGNQGPRTLGADNTSKYLEKDGTCHVVRLDNEDHRKFDVSNMYLKEQYAAAFMEAQRGE
jgi:hypothetical protein